MAYLRCAAEVLSAHAAVADDGSGTLVALKQQVVELVQAGEQQVQQQEGLVAALACLAGAPVRAAAAAALASLE